MEKKLLKNLPFEQVSPNDENTRIIFRQEELDISAVSSGVYFMRICSKNVQKCFKILKE